MRSANLLIKQARQFLPNVVVIGEDQYYQEVFDALNPLDIKVYAGQKALDEVVRMDVVDVVLTALVGYAGLSPTISAIRAGKNIALANKETLVIAGELISRLTAENSVHIFPVDSEHSAIFQCLVGEPGNAIEKIILTASGGPFRGFDIQKLKNVTAAQALKHPNWDMGAKITIDSATMMNKGLEVIEAKWLFGVHEDQIDVVVHPQSIVHSLVQFEDGSLKAQMGLPDMRLPIQYALSYPERIKSDFPRFDFMNYPELTFEQPDKKTFRNLALAYEVIEKGGNAPCIMNAANEIAVQAFLKDQIGFLEIAEVVEDALATVVHISNPVLEDFVETDTITRIKAKEKINTWVVH